MSLLDNAILDLLNRIKLNKTTGMATATDGIHVSGSHGDGIEFVNHGEYNPGDPVKRINWRLLARQEKVYIKRFVREVKTNVNIFVDCSGSMTFGDKEIATKMLAAALTYLYLNQGDEVRLIFFNDSIVTKSPLFHSVNAFSSSEKFIEAIKFSGKSSIGYLNKEIFSFGKSKKLLMISDLFVPFNSIEQLAKLTFGLHINADFFHILDQKEIDFPFTGYSRFICPEDTSFDLKINPASIKDRYKKAMNRFIDNVNRLLSDYGFFYYNFVAGINFVNSLGAMAARYGAV